MQVLGANMHRQPRPETIQLRKTLLELAGRERGKEPREQLVEFGVIVRQ